MSIAVERRYNKDQILTMYLNSVYFGENAFGIEEAAKVYFGKLPKDLNVAESSMLVGLLPAPSLYSPVSGDAAEAKRQQKTVLKRMANEGYITKEKELSVKIPAGIDDGQTLRISKSKPRSSSWRMPIINLKKPTQPRRILQRWLLKN